MVDASRRTARKILLRRNTMKSKINTTDQQTLSPLLGDGSDSKNEKWIKIFQYANCIDPEEILENYEANDLGFGKLFSDTYSRVLKFVSDAGIWRHYDGARWVDDTSETFVEHCARLLVNYLKSKDNEGIEFFTGQLSRLSIRKTMIKDARSISPVKMADFDSDPLLLNALNCTIDLRDPSRREHNPDDLLTKTANVKYDPSAKCDRWDKFIEEIMCGDENLAAFLQRALGYALSGDVSKECLFILWGRTTRNGKGTLMETLLKIMGDYAKSLSPAVLSQKSKSSDLPSPELAGVAGVRLVTVSEPDKGMKLNAALVKRLTGGDPILARYLRRNPIEYRPQFKMFINTNHLMEIDDDTVFSSGRIMMIPFEKHFEEKDRDHTLKDTLKSPKNASGIFNWLLQGYRNFKAKDLKAPEKSVKALNTYRQECDTIALFMESMLVKCGEGEWIKTSNLYNDYRKWYTSCDIEGKSQKEFVDTLRQKGLLSRHNTDGHIVRGYKMKPNEDAKADDGGSLEDTQTRSNQCSTTVIRRKSQK